MALASAALSIPVIDSIPGFSLMIAGISLATNQFHYCSVTRHIRPHFLPLLLSHLLPPPPPPPQFQFLCQNDEFLSEFDAGRQVTSAIFILCFTSATRCPHPPPNLLKSINKWINNNKRRIREPIWFQPPVEFHPGASRPQRNISNSLPDCQIYSWMTVTQPQSNNKTTTTTTTTTTKMAINQRINQRRKREEEEEGEDWGQRSRRPGAPSIVIFHLGCKFALAATHWFIFSPILIVWIVIGRVVRAVDVTDRARHLSAAGDTRSAMARPLPPPSPKFQISGCHREKWIHGFHQRFVSMWQRAAVTHHIPMTKHADRWRWDSPDSLNFNGHRFESTWSRLHLRLISVR